MEDQNMGQVTQQLDKLTTALQQIADNVETLEIALKIILPEAPAEVTGTTEEEGLVPLASVIRHSWYIANKIASQIHSISIRLEL